MSIGTLSDMYLEYCKPMKQRRLLQPTLFLSRGNVVFTSCDVWCSSVWGFIAKKKEEKNY